MSSKSDAKWTGCFFLIVFSVILGVVLGFLDLPEALEYAIMIVAIIIPKKLNMNAFLTEADRPAANTPL